VEVERKKVKKGKAEKEKKDGQAKLF